MRRAYNLWVTVNRVHDGDTIYADIDQALGIWNRGLADDGMGLRLYGSNSRELSEPGGPEARANLERLIPVGSVLQVESIKWDKYAGRIDVRINLPGIGDLVTYLIAQQWAAGPYYGSGTKPVPPWPRTITP